MKLKGFRQRSIWKEIFFNVRMVQLMLTNLIVFFVISASFSSEYWLVHWGHCGCHINSYFLEVNESSNRSFFVSSVIRLFTKRCTWPQGSFLNLWGSWTLWRSPRCSATCRWPGRFRARESPSWSASSRPGRGTWSTRAARSSRRRAGAGWTWVRAGSAPLRTLWPSALKKNWLISFLLISNLGWKCR